MNTGICGKQKEFRRGKMSCGFLYYIMEYNLAVFRDISCVYHFQQSMPYMLIMNDLL